MSHLRAPAARADRREGGRHGRPAARTAPALPETHIRPQLLRLAVLPPVAVTLSACAAVLFVVRSTGIRPSLTVWAVLASAVSVTLAGILIAAVAANRTARSVNDRIRALRRSSARGEADLRALVETLRRGEAPPKRKSRSGPPEDADDFELLAGDLARAHDGAVTAVVQAAQLSSQAGSEQKLEVFVNLARRLQSLVHREISILDELENEIEDPDLLKGLFHVDHLATRIRRHAENLAVLGGAVSRRQWSNPVSMTEVLRSAIAEVEQYSRVKLVPPIDGTLRGHAVADVIHLLAELVENATVFSAPHTQVLLRANLVTSGLAVEVEDRGLGMPVGEQNRMNALLTDPDQVNVASLLADGRIGLFVVSQLAKRHGIHVRLQTNIYGGVQAVLVVPQGLLGNEPGARAGVGRGPEPQQGAAAGAGTGMSAQALAQAAPSSPQVRQQQGPVPSQQRRHAAAAGAGTAAGSASTASAAAGAASGAAESGGRRGMGEASQASSASHGAPRRQEPPQGGARSAVPRANGAGPAPLPVRGAQAERANPAEAVPGIRPDERRRVEENAGAPPTPRVSTVRGTMGKPQLPRRRAQEHIAPQLRGGPAPRQESDQLAGHDPGLMAAFQRGIGLAETQQHMESARGDAEHVDAGYMGADHIGTDRMGTDHVGADRIGTDQTGTDHMSADHMGTGTGHTPTSHMATGHTNSGHNSTGHTTTGHTAAGHMGTGYVGAAHVDSAHTPSTHGITPAYIPSPHTTSETTSPTPEPTHPDPLVSQPTRLESVRPASSRPEPTSLDTARSQPTRLRPASLDGLHMDVTPMTTRPSMDVSPMDAAHMTEPNPGPAPGTDHTTWPDGSAPAG
ncbi:ATP-binding protein [Streptomyces sp. KS_5]|uniref:sensor histidine kinase n=1 Tax=Streptomyces TaxID=1883 RepID=UPI00089860C1|nr:Signal transduction histidine kinase [Streptomyces sp. KS_5]SED54806.1 Signal transduction histidine kinase [Streptomyces sp. PAN_FS17]